MLLQKLDHLYKLLEAEKVSTPQSGSILIPKDPRISIRENDLSRAMLEHWGEIRSALVEASNKQTVGLFWHTADGRRHFCPDAFKRGDIHDNGRPINLAILGEEVI